LSAQSEIAGNAAPPHVFERKDGAGKVIKSYRLRLIDDSLNVEWERKQLAKARDFEAGNKPLLTREEFAERLDKLSERYHAGEYSLFRWLVKNQGIVGQAKGDQSGLADRLLNNPEVAHNFILLFSLIFGCDEMEMMKLLVECGPEVTTFVGLVVRESMPAGNGTANGAAPEGTPRPNA
jgi:hypothetical protein